MVLPCRTVKMWALAQDPLTHLPFPSLCVWPSHTKPSWALTGTGCLCWPGSCLTAAASVGPGGWRRSPTQQVLPCSLWSYMHGWHSWEVCTVNYWYSFHGGNIPTRCDRTEKFVALCGGAELEFLSAHWQTRTFLSVTAAILLVLRNYLKLKLYLPGSTVRKCASMCGRVGSKWESSAS